MSFQIGDRIGVVKGGLDGYYGRVSARVRNVGGARPYVGVRIQANGLGETNPRFTGGEWFLPLDYLEHID